ncbi:tetratricopeptide repeat protein [Thiorhodovibrio frisius]|uniref:Tetratricopeptide repeat protein n=1 Tax=Thiorhodovibrio frisius TaxID=631362 RepID=H8YX97_9GAMM|nr:hypothetical protein [Thiorhodovibrio frisius]EIC23073.1 hypothetical protein Thi970DRAFT_00724 [Thiorhodovibrio frisius]WPL22662.1 hypothetical protein Thiofri_02832 [Thiorhodovibrio frisius]
MRTGLISILLALVTFKSGAYSPSGSDHIDLWIGNLPMPVSAREALRARREVSPKSNQWLTEQDGRVYVLVALPLAAGMPGPVRISKSGVAEMKARHALLLYAVGEHFEQLGYSNREAIAQALVAVEADTSGRLLRGVQSRATLLADQAVAFVWTDVKNLSVLRHRPPSVEQFLPAYCVALYPTAQALFIENQYSEALQIYQAMHQLQCPRPLAYFLDAADCFLALEQPQDAGRMARHVLTQPDAALSSAIVERAGDILHQCGADEDAEKAYELALGLLQQQR